MTRYDLLLFLHISFAIMWVGAGMLFHILGFRADRARNEGAMRQLFDDLVALANVFFIPSSLLVLVFGILLVADSDFYAFDQLWIVLGFVGFAITFLTGLLWIKPQSERVKKMIEPRRRDEPAGLQRGAPDDRLLAARLRRPVPGRRGHGRSSRPRTTRGRWSGWR